MSTSRNPSSASPTKATEDKIIEAMRNHRAVSFTYEGQPRMVTPYALYHDRRGKVMLHAWQTGGMSHSQVLPCWVNCRVDQISKLAFCGEAERMPYPKFEPTRYKRLIHLVS